MFCRYCGKKMDDKAVVCTGCGRPVEGPSRFDGEDSWSFMTMVGLIAATLFLPPVGLVAGVMGLRNEAKKSQGAVLLTVAIFMSLLMTAIILGL